MKNKVRIYKEVFAALPSFPGMSENDEMRTYKEIFNYLPSYSKLGCNAPEELPELWDGSLHFPELRLESDSSQDLRNQLSKLKDQRLQIIDEMNALKDVLKEKEGKISSCHKNLHKHKVKKRQDLHRELAGAKRFFLQDGTTIGSLSTLAQRLKSMKSTEFKKHVYKDHNDFSNWAKDCFHIKGLARKMKKAKTKKALIRVLEESLV